MLRRLLMFCLLLIAAPSGAQEQDGAEPMLLVATKMDAAQDPDRIARLRQLAKERDLPFFQISGVTGEGLDGLRHAMAESLGMYKTA